MAVEAAGARYAFESGLTLELGYGASKDHLQNAHFKSSYRTGGGAGPLTVGYPCLFHERQRRFRKSENDNFDGLASLHYLFGKYEAPPWTFRLEGTYVRAPMSGPQSQGQFAYRLTDRSGSSSGAFDVWWDARSDWNADNEKAAYCGAMRTLDDLLPIAGFSAGRGRGFRL